MRTLVCVLALAAVPSLFADTITYDIKFGGTVAGTNTATTNADGTFESKTKFSVQGITIESSLTGKIKDGKVLEFDWNEGDGTKTGGIKWDGKVATIKSMGKVVRENVPFAPKSRALLGNFHPILLQTMLSEYKAVNKPSFEVYLLQSISPIKVDVDVAESTFTMDGKPVPVTRMKTNIAGQQFEVAVSEGVGIGLNVPAQLFQIVRHGYDSVFVDPLSKYPELSQPTHKTITERRVRGTMSRGVRLMSDIIRPAGEGKYPVILIRTPYGRAASLMGMDRYAQRGYVVVSQDVRGRGGSDGAWDPFNAEMQDGKDTLDWLASQPWCDGNVGMIGGSYLGYVQWAAAVNRHPALKCIIPQVSPPEPTKNVPWDNGNFLLAGSVWWSRIVVDRKADMAAAAEIPNLKKFLTLPLNKLDDAVIGRDVPFFNEWLKRPNRDDWKGAFTTEQVAKVKIPVLHISGAFDGDGVGTMIHWNALRKSGGNQWLIFGPWDHAFNTKTRMGDQDFGSDAVLELDSIYLRFFDTYLKGKSVKWDDQPRVRFFETVSNRWRETKDWPAASSNKLTYYLSGAKQAKGGFGTLASSPGKNYDKLKYEPSKAKIVGESHDVDPSKAVTNVMPDKLAPVLLGYRSEPFKEDTSLAGPVVAELYVSSSAKDASFHVQVFDQEPSGKLWVICQTGNMRVGFVDGKLGPIKPNKVYKITVEPWLFARTFKKGHRLVIGVRNDMFPALARIAGTGEPDISATKLLTANNRVYTSKTYPSKVTVWKLESLK